MERPSWPTDDATIAEVMWAHRYDGYRRLARSPADLAGLLEPARAEYDRTRRIPEWCGVDLLRGWAFFLVRRDHHRGGGSLDEEWRAVLDALHQHPDAAGDDRPPRRDLVGAVLGVDACKAGWVGVLLSGGTATVHVAATVRDLVQAADVEAWAEVVAIDIPIGLPDAGQRAADQLARRRVGPRAPSVFTTATRAALLAATHAEAVAVNRGLTGSGLSIQAYGLRTKILEVDAWVRTAGRTVIEVHPEVSFAELNGGHLSTAKSTAEGLEQRRAALRRQGIALPDPLRRPRVGADDVLDAAAAAWTARHYAAGEASSLPDPPEVFSDGWPAAIWV